MARTCAEIVLKRPDAARISENVKSSCRVLAHRATSQDQVLNKPKIAKMPGTPLARSWVALVVARTCLEVALKDFALANICRGRHLRIFLWKKVQRPTRQFLLGQNRAVWSVREHFSNLGRGVVETVPCEPQVREGNSKLRSNWIRKRWTAQNSTSRTQALLPPATPGSPERWVSFEKI